MKIKHIIFDFDGVIGDTFDILLALSFKYAVNNPTEEDFLAHHDGNVFMEPKVLFNTETIHLFFSEYTENIKSTHLQNAIQPIKKLAEKYSLYINSSNREKGLLKALTEAHILHYFKKVMGEETHKSKIEKFKMIFDQYAASIDDTLFITDSLGDVKEATKLGLKTIAVTFGFHDRERLETANPYMILDSWDEILKEIETLAV